MEIFVFKFWRAWLNFVKISFHSHFEISLSAVVNYQFRKCTISSFSAIMLKICFILLTFIIIENGKYFCQNNPFLCEGMQQDKVWVCAENYPTSYRSSFVYSKWKPKDKTSTCFLDMFFTCSFTRALTEIVFFRS